MHAVPGGCPELSSTTPEQLLSEVACGDAGAFDQLYDLLIAPVFGLVQRVVRNFAQAEEVTQEVFLELWRTAPRYRSELGSVRSWAFMLAHRRAVDRVRAVEAASQRDTRVGMSWLERPFDSVSERISADVEYRTIRRCLPELTEVQRQCILLAYYQGHTYRQISEILDVPLGTVKTRIRDGLIRLRDCLDVEVE
ncbi:MAG: ECF RNA polymerase sigma factor SigK [Sciscionella sp.]